MKKKVKYGSSLFVMAIMGTVMLCTGCAPERRYSESVGSFYSLDEAYENGLLTGDDLKNIAYYFHSRNGETENTDEVFTPNPKMPESLEQKIQYKIKRTYLNEIINMPNGAFDQVIIYDYFGTYNDSIVVYISDTYYAYDYVTEAQHEIGDVCFHDYCSAVLRVWREKSKQKCESDRCTGFWKVSKANDAMNVVCLRKSCFI